MVTEDLLPAAASRSVIVVSPMSDAIVPEFLLAVLQHRIVRVQFERIAIGTSVRIATPS